MPEMPWVKRWGNRMMSRLISRLAGERFYDVSCGMRCYGRRAALQLHLLARFTYTQEVLLNLAFKQLRIVEVPLRVRGEREHGESRVAASLWRYGLRTAQIIFRSYRDYRPMRFFGGIALALAAAGLRSGRVPAGPLRADRRLLPAQMGGLRRHRAGGAGAADAPDRASSATC